MPAAQLALVETAAAASSKPLVVVFFGSTPLDISPLLANPKVRPEPLRPLRLLRSLRPLHPSRPSRPPRPPPSDLSPLPPATPAQVGAVLHLGQPSVQLGGAADIIFGKSVPAGKTIQTILPTEYMNMISIFDFNSAPTPSSQPASTPPCRAQ